MELNFINKKSKKVISLGKNNYLNASDIYEENSNMPEPADVDYKYNFWSSVDKSDWIRQGYQVPVTVYLNTNHYFNQNDVENRYYMKVSDVESCIRYCEFNNNEEIVGKHLFVTNRTEEEWYNLYAGSGIVRVNGINYIPLNTVEESGDLNVINIFYFPNNTLTEENSPVSYYDESVRNRETLYPISIVENGTIVEKYYVATGQKWEKELKSFNDTYKWEMKDNTGKITELSSNLVEIPSVNSWYDIYNVVDNNFAYIKYDINNQWNIKVKGKEDNFIDKINLNNLSEYTVLDMSAHEYIENQKGKCINIKM